MVGQINVLIETKNIREITFVLSDNNRIVIDALKNHDFIDVRGCNNFSYQRVMSYVFPFTKRVA